MNQVRSKTTSDHASFGVSGVLAQTSSCPEEPTVPDSSLICIQWHHTASFKSGLLGDFHRNQQVLPVIYQYSTACPASQWQAPSFHDFLLFSVETDSFLKKLFFTNTIFKHLYHTSLSPDLRNLKKNHELCFGRKQCYFSLMKQIT